MANRLISQLTTLPSGSIAGTDYVEVQEDDSSTTKKVTVTVLNELEAAARVAQDNVIEAACGLNADGTYPTPSGTNVLDSTTDIMDALEALDAAIGGAGVVNTTVTVTSGNLNGCGTAPYEVLAAQGANKYIEVISGSAYLDHNGVDCAFTGDLVLMYDNGANHFMEWSMSFVNGSSSAMNRGAFTSDVVMLANEGLELTTSDSGDSAAGNAALKLNLTYVIRDYNVS